MSTARTSQYLCLAHSVFTSHFLVGEKSLRRSPTGNGTVIKTSPNMSHRKKGSYSTPRYFINVLSTCVLDCMVPPPNSSTPLPPSFALHLWIVEFTLHSFPRHRLSVCKLLCFDVIVYEYAALMFFTSILGLASSGPPGST